MVGICSIKSSLWVVDVRSILDVLGAIDLCVRNSGVTAVVESIGVLSGDPN
jgi:hypothetical protein